MIRHKALTVIAFAFLCNLFFDRLFGIAGFAIFSILSFIFLLIGFIGEIRTKNLGKTMAVHGIFLAGFALNAVSTDNDFVIALQILSILLLLGMMAYLLISELPAYRTVLELLLSPLRLLVRYLSGIPSWFEVLFTKKWKNAIPQSRLVFGLVKPIAIGLIIGLPVAFMVAGLLSSADPIFKAFVAAIHLPKISEEIFWRTIITFVVAFVLMPLVFVKTHDGFKNPVQHLLKLNFVKEITVVIALIAAVLGVFLVVQAPYVFVRVAFETDLLKYGVATYSEYVRRGFGELIFVVFIVYGILWAAIIGLRSSGKEMEKKVLRFFFAVLYLEVWIFIASIARRVFLYQAYHGWSLIRIYGLWLLFFLGMMLLTLAFRQFKKFSFVRVEIAGSFILLLILGRFNAEKFIVDTHPPTVNKRVDYVYLSRLSADGYSGWLKSYRFAGEVLRERGYGEKEINAEGRRDIAYSSSIVRGLLGRFYALVSQYGTDQEQKNYATLMLKSLETAYEKVNQIDGERKRLEVVKKTLADLGSDAVSARAAMRVFARSYSLRDVADGENYFTKPVNVEFIDSMYRIVNEGELPKAEPAAFLDKVYTWNFSQYLTYEKMKKEIPVEDLLGLSDTYFRLYHKVISQPESERKYQSDISFNMPFVD